MLLAAFAAARRALTAYSHRFSPQKFTQHQLFACLVLKNFRKTDYRGVVQHLRDEPALAECLELKQIPHFSTVHKAARRLLMARSVRKLLDVTVRKHLGRRRSVKVAAIDSTGLECTAASGYFVRRRTRISEPWKRVEYHHFPKLGIVCETGSHFILAIDVGRGPRPDVDEFRPLVSEACARVRIACIVADAGYDSEPNHRHAREQLEVRSVIPAKHGRPTHKPASGRYRRLMQTRFDRIVYRLRSQIETVISMIKRRQGSHVHGRTYQSQCRDLRLMALTHNIMILWVAWFSTEPSRLSSWR